MKTAIVCFLVLLGTVGLFANQKAKPCTKQDAIRADQEASSLRSWAEVYKSYKTFAQCDDAGIGEGYSESVARLLSDQWKGADELNRLVAHDKGFERFVVRHVDELMSPAQAEKIRDNAEAHCPLHAGELCKLLAAKIRKMPA